MIDWSAFTWEAFATLATGFAAVCGAVAIGHRQNLILRGQSKIADRQTLLQELEARSALFDRRYDVYRASQTFLSQVSITEGRIPDDLVRPFIDAMDRAVFLFRPEVAEELRGGYNLAYKSRTMEQRVTQDNFANESERMSAIDQAVRVREELRKLMQKLVPLMCDEMTLYIED